MILRSLKNFLVLAACLAVAAALGASRALAQTDRHTLVQESLSQSRDNSSLYQSAPVTHVIPAFNTITYALELDYKNVTVTPQQTGTTDSASLKQGGYTAAPYVTVSLRNFGLGFSVEDGQRTDSYTDAWPSQPWANWGSSTQKSVANYTALGAYVYWIPLPQSKIAPTVVLGAKSYNVGHDYGDSESSTSPAQAGQSTSTRYNYGLTQYEVGLDVPISILKNFMLIPWVDYTYVDLRSAEQMDGYDQGFQDDLQLFWNSDPKVRFGLDFAVKIDRFEVHLGSLFGLLAPTAPSVPWYQDKSLSLSLSLDQKGS